MHDREHVKPVVLLCAISALFWFPVPVWYPVPAGASVTPGQEAPRIQLLTNQKPVCETCIHVEPTVALGDADGPGYVVATDWVVRDSLGRYWVGQYRDMIKVYDSTGRYVRQVGRPGAGPLEFRTPLPVVTDSGGRVHVVDPGNARVSVIGPDFALAQEYRLPLSVWHAASLPDADSYVLNAAISTADGIGLPLHIVRRSAIVRSFGMSGTGVVNPSRLYRLLATDRLGRIYAAWPYEYVIEVWNDAGSLMRRLEGPAVSEGQPRGGVYSDRNPPLSRIAALRVDASNRLWLILSMRRADWRAGMRELRLSGGRVALEPLNDDWGLIYRTEIHVIDLLSPAQIGRTIREEYIDAFVGDGLVLEDRVSDDGTPRLVVWKMSWVER